MSDRKIFCSPVRAITTAINAIRVGKAHPTLRL